jgi:hypothetical protein
MQTRFFSLQHSPIFIKSLSSAARPSISWRLIARIVVDGPGNRKQVLLRKLNLDIVQGLRNEFSQLAQDKSPWFLFNITDNKTRSSQKMTPHSLEEFSCILPAHKEILDYLSPSVRYLQLFIGYAFRDHSSNDPRVINSPDDFLSYIKNSLITLSVVTQPDSLSPWISNAYPKDDIEVLRSACDNLRISLEYSRKLI